LAAIGSDIGRKRK